MSHLPAFIDYFMALLILLWLRESTRHAKISRIWELFQQSMKNWLSREFWCKIVVNKTKIVINYDLNNRMKFHAFCRFLSWCFYSRMISRYANVLSRSRNILFLQHNHSPVMVWQYYEQFMPNLVLNMNELPLSLTRR